MVKIIDQSCQVKKTMSVGFRTLLFLEMAFLYVITLGNTIFSSTTLTQKKSDFLAGEFIRTITIHIKQDGNFSNAVTFVNSTSGINATLEEIQNTGSRSDPYCLQPKIVADSWGSITCLFSGKYSTHKDAVLLPNQPSKEWKWDAVTVQQKKLSHDGKGSQERVLGIEDLDYWIFKPCIKRGTLPEVIILTMGRGHQNKGPGILKIRTQLVNEIYAYSKKNGLPIKKVLVLKTAEALQKYEELSKAGIPTAMMTHTTC